MQPQKRLSRRNAISMMAGTIAISSAPAAAVQLSEGIKAGPESDATTLLAASRTRMLTNLAKVPLAIGPYSQRKAYDEFKASFVSYDHAALVTASEMQHARSNGKLYRQDSPEHAVVRTLVRELDALPLHHPCLESQIS